MALTMDVVHEQGEMDADGGHPTVRGLVVVEKEVVVDVGRLVVVDVAVLLVEETLVEDVVGGRLVVVVGGTVVVGLLQLVKPNGFRVEKVVPFEQVPPLAMFKNCGLSRMSHAKSHRFVTQLIGSKQINW